jgi:hemolysin III
MNNLPNQFFYSKKEDRLNVISHGLGFILSIIGLVFLINKGLQNFNFTYFISLIIYGVSLSTMYIASTLYHNSKTAKCRYNMRMFDMISIYILIAGSYTPFTLILLKDNQGWFLFTIIWLLALFGIVWKIFTIGKYNLVTTSLYIFMGGLWLFFYDSFIAQIPSDALWWIIAGCLTYLAGVIFYLLDNKLKYNHFIWHLFVLAASGCHYISIYFYI